MITEMQREVGKELKAMLTIMIKDASEAGLPIIAQSLELGLAVIRFELGETSENDKNVEN